MTDVLDYVLPILNAFVPIWTDILFPIFALALLATLPCLIRYLIKWR